MRLVVTLPALMKSARISIAAFALVALVTQSVAFASDAYICPMTGREMVGCTDDSSPAAPCAALQRSCCCELRKGHPLQPPVAVRDGALHLAPLTALPSEPLTLDASDLGAVSVVVPGSEERPPGCPRYLALRQLLI